MTELLIIIGKWLGCGALLGVGAFVAFMLLLYREIDTRAELKNKIGFLRQGVISVRDLLKNIPQTKARDEVIESLETLLAGTKTK